MFRGGPEQKFFLEPEQKIFSGAGVGAKIFFRSRSLGKPEINYILLYFDIKTYYACKYF
jgi:hypothetical protein